MYDTSARRVTNLYCDPRGDYAADVLHHAIQTRTELVWNQWDGREPSVNPETLAEIFLIGGGDHCTVVVKNCNGHWVHKDDLRTIPIVNLHKFLSGKSKSGSVYYFDDLETKTIRDRVTELRPQKRDRPANSPAKADEIRGRKGKTQHPKNKSTTPQPPRQQPHPQSQVLFRHRR